jgi:hypothetical protein
LDAGIIYGMKAERKITVHVGKDLLQRAQRASRAGVSETVRKGLELLAANDAYEGLLKLQGKVKFSIDLDELRKDKR